MSSLHQVSGWARRSALSFHDRLGESRERLLNAALRQRRKRGNGLARPTVGLSERSARSFVFAEFGDDPVTSRPVVARDGRFGVYVTDGETNASIGRGDRIEEMTPERAFELLAVRREQVAAKGGPAKKASRARKSPAKKSPSKRSAAKKDPLE